jgi:group I intron endonuclease
MKKCGIYGIKNLANGKWYIGQSVDIERRQENHFYCLKGGYHFNTHLQKAFDKYGINNFTFHVLEVTSEPMLDIRERAWIMYYQSTQEQWGYNLEGGGHVNKHLTAEVRKKISEAKKRQPLYNGQLEVMKKIHKAQIGKPQSPEHLKHLSEARTGLRRSSATRLKMSLASRGKPKSAAHVKHMADAMRALYLARRNASHLNLDNAPASISLPPKVISS